jgi:hypothetical protein
MTSQQTQQLAAALQRAQAQKIEIVAHGTRKSDGAPIYLVTSASRPGTSQMVALVHDRLTCTRKADQQSIICKHQALVHARRTAEANAPRRVDAVTRETAPLYWGNRPVSNCK